MGCSMLNRGGRVGESYLWESVSKISKGQMEGQFRPWRMSMIATGYVAYEVVGCLDGGMVDGFGGSAAQLIPRETKATRR